MQIKEGNGWKVCLNEENGRCFGEYGGVMAYDLYELSRDQFDMLTSGMTEGEAASVMHDGRHLYMSVDDRCGPPYTVIFDEEYETLCPWARIIRSGRVWSDELTDAAVEIFESEKNNRPQRRRRRRSREIEPKTDERSDNEI